MKRLLLLLVGAAFAFASAASAAQIASSDLEIRGLSLRIVDTAVTVPVNTAIRVQTELGGKTNEAAAPLPGIFVVGELIGPGIETPVAFSTRPGYPFHIAGLPREGTYLLQNIRLVRDGAFFQQATPSIVTITVTNALRTSVKVRQLTADEIRARGISLDERNYDVFEYEFTFFLENGEKVVVPYEVKIDKRTHEAAPITREYPYDLPPIQAATPPRWSPPRTIAVELADDSELPQASSQAQPGVTAPPRPRIPAAIVIPNDLAVLHQFGYGIGVYDLNAIESNDTDVKPADYESLQELVRLTRAKNDPSCTTTGAEPTEFAIPDLTLSPEAVIRTSEITPDLGVYALDFYRGILDLKIAPPTQSSDLVPQSCTERSPNGLLFRSTYVDETGATLVHDHSRLATLREAFTSAASREPFARFSSAAFYRWRLEAKDNATGLRGSLPNIAVTRDYMLVAGRDYGLLVVEIGGNAPAAFPSHRPLGDQHLVDIVWIPGGAYAVRAIPRTSLATVVDGEGRVLLIDLKRIDERWNEDGELLAPDALFPSVEAALACGAPDLGCGDGDAVGSDDGRVVWKSEPGVVSGTLAPVIDADSGMLFAGELIGKKLSVISAIDPRIQLKVDLGEPHGLSEVGGIVPLGVAPPDAIQKKIDGLPEDRKKDASLAAFRVELTLPGAMTETAGCGAADSGGVCDSLAIAVESERVFNAVTEQTPDGFPRAHLRLRTRDGEDDPRAPEHFNLESVVPVELRDELRHQKGFNKFISPWIVALADPRASQNYIWPAGADAETKKSLGCASCERPAHLKDKKEADGVYELLTNGRTIAIRPETGVAPPATAAATSSIFDGTPYEYLGEQNRLTARFDTVIADTVRATDVLGAAQNPPIADGLIQETIFLHSGELQSQAVDLIAGGRAGFDVLFDRTYRSRTLGGTAIGAGWDASMFRRLRPLPNGSIEYRDGTGEIWLFSPLSAGEGSGVRVSGDATYQSPKGLFLKLTRTADGWTLTDQQRRLTAFDRHGRLSYETDHFYKPEDPASGNVIRYLYDEQGRLASVVDPVGRTTNLTYWSDEEAATAGAFPGYLKEIEDWRERKVTFSYDERLGTLESVALPEVENTSGGRPATYYTYAAAGTAYNDALELASNLDSIRDPGETEPRVRFAYTTSSEERDQLTSQIWGTGETVQITSGVVAEVTDALGQRRTYSFDKMEPVTNLSDDRVHVASVDEHDIEIWSAGFGALPGTITAAVPTTTTTTRRTTFEYDEDGLLTSETTDGVRTASYIYADITTTGAAGKLLTSTTVSPAGASASAASTTSAATEVARAARPQSRGRLGRESTVIPSKGGRAAGARDLASSAAATSSTSSLQPLGSGPSITYTYEYQSGDGANAFMKAISASGLRIEQPSPHRGTTGTSHLTSLNDQITSTTKINDHGQIESLKTSGGTDASSAGSDVRIKYEEEDGPQHARGLPREIDRGDGVSRKLEYPDENTVIQTDERGIITTTQLDAWRRPVHVTVAGPGLTLDERFSYDAAGRLVRHVRRQGSDDVTTEYDYDLLGRLTQTRVNNVATTSGVLETKVSYDLTNRRIVTTLPGGATQTADLDRRGLTKTVTTATGGSPIALHHAYDLDGNPVFASDGHAASAVAFDAYGRAAETLSLDGVRATGEFDAWGNPTRIAATSATGELISEQTFDRTETGRVRAATEKLDASRTRQTQTAWDGAGRTTGVSSGGRASRQNFDVSGRLKSAKSGAGDAASISEVFSELNVSSHEGLLPAAMTASDRSGASYESARAYDTLGLATNERLGSLEWRTKFDQAGNVIEAADPQRNAATYDVDARGAVTEERLPDGAANQFAIDASGALSRYTDPVSEATSVENDLLGRPLVRHYPDSTREVFTWDGTRLTAFTDRQGRTQNFIYNTKNQLTEIHLGGGEVVDRIEYDDAGRISAWTTRDAKLTWEEFDFEGRPGKTTQTRYKNGSGFGVAEVLDRYEQEYDYNEQGEWTRRTMPSYEGFAPKPEWTRELTAQYDAAGNLTTLNRSLFGGAAGALVSSDYAAGGRPNRRTITSPAGASINRSYGYNAATGQLEEVAVTSGGATVAGSRVTYDGLQIAEAQLLGVGGGAYRNRWSYDARGRLANAVIGRSGGANEVLTPADFRAQVERAPRFDAATREALRSRGINPDEIDRPSMTATEQTGHKIASITEGEATRPFAWQGSERVDDGRFMYEFDAKGRLVRATEKLRTPAPPVLLRVYYYYDGNDRRIGRRAEMARLAGGTTSAPTEDAWELASPEYLPSGLPAEVTYVLGLDDRIAAVFKAGASENPETDEHGGLLRQFIHGDLAYDDPLVVTLPDATAPSIVRELYPVYDEAGAGSLQAIFNSQGDLVARTVVGDAYGDEQTTLRGAAVDRVAVVAEKSADGTLTSVNVTMRLTEPVNGATLASGTVLRSVNTDGSEIRKASATPVLFDPLTVSYTLSQAEWEALTAGAAALSVAATNTLRVTGWSEAEPVMNAPEWATASLTVFTSPETSIEVRESLATLSTWLASLPPGTSARTLYEVKDLPLVAPSAGNADDPTRRILLSAFHAAPLQDDITGLIYLRARDLDPRTGTFLTPDPMGYEDSPNSYAFAAGDSVNRRDATGESWKTFFEGAAEGAANLVFGALQAGERAVNPAAAANPFLKSINFTTTGPVVVSSVRDPNEELKSATVIIPIAEMLGRFTGNIIETVAASVDPTAPQGYLDELHKDLGRDTPGIALTVAPLPKIIRGGRAGAQRIVARSPKLTPNQKGGLGSGWSRKSALQRGGQIVGEEVDLIFQIDGKDVGIRADVLSLEGLDYVYIESKYSAGAGYTPHQRVVIPKLVKAGDAGLVARVGPRSGTLNPGDKIRVVFQGDVWSGAPKLHGQ